MTTDKTINDTTIMPFLLRSKCYQSVRARYGLNYNCITFLIGCYIYSKYIDSSFSLHKVYKFISYYKYEIGKRYIDQLVNSNLINLTGRKYSITELGYSAIQEISDNNNRVLYEFCSKYNIEL